MNPYDEPLAKLSVPADKPTVSAKTISWLAIFTSCAFTFLLAITFYVCLKLALLPHAPSLLMIIFPFQWLPGSVYLAKKVRYRWVAHGFLNAMLQALVTLLTTVLFMGVPPGVLVILPVFAIWLALSIAITLITMLVTRILVISREA